MSEVSKSKMIWTCFIHNAVGKTTVTTGHQCPPAGCHAGIDDDCEFKSFCWNVDRYSINETVIQN